MDGSIRPDVYALFVHNIRTGRYYEGTTIRGDCRILGWKGYWNPYREGNQNEPKDSPDNHIRNFRVGSRTVRGAARTRRRRQNSVSRHGPARPVPDSGSKR